MSKGKSKGSNCPSCGQAATGNFCQHCGATLGGRFCNQCGTDLPAGAAFCNQCGHKVSGAEGGRRAAAAAAVTGENLPWWIAGVAMFAVILVVGVNYVQPNGPVTPPPTQAPASGPAPDISNLSPVERADALFDRVMRTISAGDSTGAQFFLPMAIAAHDQARPLDADRLFHLSMLNRTAMNLEAALDNAIEVLEANPDHILALAAAAEAAIELGEPDEAARHYQHLFDVYDAQMADPLPEYLDHIAISEQIKLDAERYLSSR